MCFRFGKTHARRVPKADLRQTGGLDGAWDRVSRSRRRPALFADSTAEVPLRRFVERIRRIAMWNVARTNSAGKAS